MLWPPAIRVSGASKLRRPAMVESGVGAAFNLAYALSPGVTNPGDVIPPLRYFRKDLIRPEMELSADGTVTLPGGPGTAYEVYEEALEEFTRERWSAG